MYEQQNNSFSALNDDNQSKFNSGVSYLDRCDRLLRALDELTAARGQLTELKEVREGWRKNYYALLALFKELSAKMDKKEKEETWFKMVEIEKLMLDAIRTSGGKINISFVREFDELELFLRQIHQDKGLNMPSKADLRWAMGNQS